MDLRSSERSSCGYDQPNTMKTEHHKKVLKKSTFRTNNGRLVQEITMQQIWKVVSTSLHFRLYAKKDPKIYEFQLMPFKNRLLSLMLMNMSVYMLLVLEKKRHCSPPGLVPCLR